ncbi:MAG: hypothetical protein ACLTVB_00770 [Sutterella sp.]
MHRVFCDGLGKSDGFLKKRPDLKVVLLNADMKTIALTPAAKKVFVLTDKEMTEKVVE